MYEIRDINVDLWVNLGVNVYIYIVHELSMLVI